MEAKFKLNQHVSGNFGTGIIAEEPTMMAGKWFYRISPDIPNEDFRLLTKAENDLNFVESLTKEEFAESKGETGAIPVHVG